MQKPLLICLFLVAVCYANVNSEVVIHEHENETQPSPVSWVDYWMQSIQSTFTSRFVPSKKCGPSSVPRVAKAFRSIDEAKSINGRTDKESGTDLHSKIEIPPINIPPALAPYIPPTIVLPPVVPPFEIPPSIVLPPAVPPFSRVEAEDKAVKQNIKITQKGPPKLPPAIAPVVAPFELPPAVPSFELPPAVTPVVAQVIAPIVLQPIPELPPFNIPPIPAIPPLPPVPPFNIPPALVPYIPPTIVLPPIVPPFVFPPAVVLPPAIPPFNQIEAQDNAVKHDIKIADKEPPELPPAIAPVVAPIELPPIPELPPFNIPPIPAIPPLPPVPPFNIPPALVPYIPPTIVLPPVVPPFVFPPAVVLPPAIPPFGGSGVRDASISSSHNCDSVDNHHKESLIDDNVKRNKKVMEQHKGEIKIAVI